MDGDSFPRWSTRNSLLRLELMDWVLFIFIRTLLSVSNKAKAFDRAKFTKFFVQYLSAVANSNPVQLDRDNLFLPRFSLSSESTLAATYAKDKIFCQQLRSELEVDPAGLIVDLYPIAVKKNDSMIRLGKVDFNKVSAASVWTNQVEKLQICSFFSLRSP